MKKFAFFILYAFASIFAITYSMNHDFSTVKKQVMTGADVLISEKIGLIKENPQYGNPISKKLIPNEYKEKYRITNLFRVELPNFWRMLYALTEGETKIEIISFVLDIIDHDTYNKKFGYKK